MVIKCLLKRRSLPRKMPPTSSPALHTLQESGFERSMWLWGRDALVLGQLNRPSGTSSRRVLEVGCGSGLLAITTATLGFNVTATDLSPRMIGRLESRLALLGDTPAVATRVVDGQTLEGFPDHSFDVVLSAFGIFLFPDRVAGWMAARRVLEQQGKLLAVSWDIDSVNVRMMRYAKLKSRDLVGSSVMPLLSTPTPPAANRSMQAESFKQELTECGYMGVDVHTVHHTMSFSSGRELVEELVESEWGQIFFQEKDPESLKRTLLDFVDLTITGADPFEDNASDLLAAEPSVSAECHPLWSRAFALQGVAHVAVAISP